MRVVRLFEIQEFWIHKRAGKRGFPALLCVMCEALYRDRVFAPGFVVTVPAVDFAIRPLEALARRAAAGASSFSVMTHFDILLI